MVAQLVLSPSIYIFFINWLNWLATPPCHSCAAVGFLQLQQCGNERGGAAITYGSN